MSYVQGADTDKRVGHARATAKGWLTPTETCRAATWTLFGTFLCGAYIAATTQQWNNPVIWFVICSSIFNAFAYTAGPYPLGYIGLEKWSIAYSGLGDVFVLLYFGYVATLTLPYLSHCQGEHVDWEESFLYATAVGGLATNILVVNNLRDRLTDVHANKRTTSVRFGRQFSLIEYLLCLLVAMLGVVLVAFKRQSFSPWRLLPLLVIPWAVKETQSILVKEGEHLNPHVGGAAKIEFCVCLLIALGKLASP
jgi:1,4-dihydroxy-2-naphthoate octaprenyltransferase